MTRRSAPSMKAICAHLGWPVGICYRCGQIARCERAHVIDSATGGGNDVSNFAPICYLCHKLQSDLGMIFEPGEEEIAWGWMRIDPYPYAWSIVHSCDLVGVPDDLIEQVVDTWVKVTLLPKWTDGISIRERTYA